MAKGDPYKLFYCPFELVGASRTDEREREENNKEKKRGEKVGWMGMMKIKH